MKFIFIILTILFSTDIIFAQTIYSYSKDNNGVNLHDTIITNIRKKCVHSYLSYKQYYNENDFPYKKLTKRFMDYIYDSTYQFHGVVAVNDTDYTNIKLLGGQFANIDLMFNELSVNGIDSLDHLIGGFYPYSNKYKAGRGKIRLSNLTTSLELYTKILSRTFDPSFFGYEVYKRKHSYLGGAILDNYWVNYHRGKTNYRYFKNGEYEIVVTTDIFVQINRFKTRKFEEAKRQCVFISPDYPYSGFEGYVPAEIKFRINPTEKTIKVKITKIKDINAIPECFLNIKKYE